MKKRNTLPKTGLQFQTAQREKAQKKKKYALIFTGIVLVLALVSVILIYTQTSLFRSEKEETYTNTTNMQSNVGVMLANVTTDGDLVTLGWFTMDTTNGKFTVTTIPVDESYQGQTYAELFGGSDADEISASNLRDAVADNYDVTLDRYIVIAEEGLGKICNTLGWYDVTLKEEINYSDDDYAIHLLSGDLSLIGSQLFSYIRYIGEDNTAASRQKQAEIIADFMYQDMTISNATNGQSYFEGLSNYLITDINVDDYARYSNFLLTVAQSPLQIEVVQPNEEA